MTPKECASGKRHIQFSKTIVVAVTAAVTVICAGGMAMCYARSDTNALVDLGRAYISYALVVFAAYSGNSAVEKWLIRKYTGASGEGNTGASSDG